MNGSVLTYHVVPNTRRYNTIQFIHGNISTYISYTYIYYSSGSQPFEPRGPLTNFFSRSRTATLPWEIVKLDLLCVYILTKLKIAFARRRPRRYPWTTGGLLTTG